MDLHAFLRRLHEMQQPRTYLEVGVNVGGSLAESRTRTIGVDPAFAVKFEVQCDLQLVRATSDDFFARPDPTAHFQGLPVDLAFIDGLHIFEYALRDFMNIERHAAWTSVIVFDDILPRNAEEAQRERFKGAWTGDIFKIIPVLQEYRPDLVVLPVNTAPTGVLVVLGADPTSTVLADSYDDIVARFATPDPQDVPLSLIRRESVLDPEAVLAAPFWDRLRDGRGRSRRRLRRVRRSASRALPLPAGPLVDFPR